MECDTTMKILTLILALVFLTPVAFADFATTLPTNDNQYRDHGSYWIWAHYNGHNASLILPSGWYPSDDSSVTTANRDHYVDVKISPENRDSKNMTNFTRGFSSEYVIVSHNLSVRFSGYPDDINAVVGGLQFDTPIPMRDDASAVNLNFTARDGDLTVTYTNNTTIRGAYVIDNHGQYFIQFPGHGTVTVDAFIGHDSNGDGVSDVLTMEYMHTFYPGYVDMDVRGIPGLLFDDGITADLVLYSSNGIIRIHGPRNDTIFAMMDMTITQGVA